MRKILFIGHRDMFFGAESVLFRVISYFRQQHQHELTVVLPVSGTNSFRQVLEGTGIPILRSPFRLVNPRPFLAFIIMIWNNMALLQLLFICRRKHIDVIYSNTSINIIGALAAWILNINHVWHFHEQPTGGNFKWIPRFLYPLYRTLLKRKKSLVVFISHQQRLMWEKEFGVELKNSEVIYTPARSIQQQPAVARKEIIFGFLGSFAGPKNIIRLIDAFGTIRTKYPDLQSRLHIMGDGGLKEDIIASIDRLKLGSAITLLPYSRDVDVFFAGIDIFVLPSNFESWGLVVLEAISQEKATIVTSNTSLTEVLENGADTIFVDPARPDELAVAMEKLLTDHVLRNNIARNGYLKIKKLNLVAAFEQGLSNLIR